MGGTSNLNFMAWIRGHPLDYDNWAAITKDEDWSYDSVLPFFKKSESFRGQGEGNFEIYSMFC